MDSTTSPKVKTVERRKSWGMFLSLQHFEGRGACWSSEMGLGRWTSNSIVKSIKQVAEQILEHVVKQGAVFFYFGLLV
jgi:hypothetical protein